MPKKQKIEEYLRFGQIVRIHGNKCLQEERDGQIMGGMITVKGFTDKDAKYTTFNQFKDCEFYRQSLFQILPKGAFQSSTANLDEAAKNKISTQYAETIIKKMGQYVRFGQDVVFKHVDSHDFLSGSVRCSDGGLGAFRVELAEHLSNDLVFKLQPFRSFEKEGDKIKLESPLRIKNISNRCYISTETKEGKHNIVTTYSKNFTWLIHLHEQHDTLEDYEQIRTHDLLFLIHTKNEGYLTLEKEGEPCIKLPNYETNLPFFTSLWEIQKYSIPTISPYSPNQVAGTDGTYSLRQVLNGYYLEVARLIDQNFIQDSDPHEITISSATSSKGSSNTNEDLKDKGLIKIQGPKNLKEGQIDAKAEQSPPQDLIYRKISPFKINAIEVITADSQNAFRVMKIDQLTKSQILFILSTFEVLQKFNEDLRRPIQIFEDTMKTDELLHIDQTLRKLIAFIKNIKDYSEQSIKAELLPNKKIQYICMELKICGILFSILAQIGTKILDEIYKSSKQKNNALKTVFNQAYYFIWQIIKGNKITKLYVCQDWIDIILDHAIQLQQDTVHDCLNEILQNNDQVVTLFLSKDNNKLVQRIINIFALKPPHEKFLKIFSASCISNNFPIVDNQNLILNEFLKKLDQTSKFELRYDIQHEIINEDVPPDAVIHVQTLGSKPKIKTVYIDCYISKDYPATRRLKKFFDESERIDLHQTSNYFISYLNLLADICYGKNTEAKNYVETILKPQRIKDGLDMIREQEQPVEEVSILDFLVAMLQDDQMNKQNTSGSINLQRATLRLINNAYIESADLSPVIRINRYRNLDQMQQQEQEMSKQNFYNIMEFIKTQISLFKSFFADNIQGKDKDKISLQIKMRLFTILNLLRSTLINGMWTIQQQQNQILPLLITILGNNTSDILEGKQQSQFVTNQQMIEQFQSFKKQVSKPTPSVEKIISCKALTCQLIEIIFDFRFNSLITESVKFYKDLEEEKDENLKSLHKIAVSIAQLKSDAKGPLLNNCDLWKQKLNKILNKEDPQGEKLKEAIGLLIPLMVQLSIHKDSRLFFVSLKILKRHFQLTSSIKDKLLKLSLYDNKNGSYLVYQIMEKRKQFNKLEEESLLYLDMTESPYTNISNFLAWLSQSLKVGAKLQRQIDANNYYSIFQHFNEQSKIDKFHQRLIKNTDLHPLLINFLNLSKQPLQKFNEHAKKVLKYVYRFLTLLARNFKEAKNEMIKIADTVRKHTQQQGLSIIAKNSNQLRNQLRPAHFELGILITQDDKAKMRERHDCQAILFLNELFTDNKDILYNENFMEDIANSMTLLVDQIPIEDYYKSHVLDFFRSMTYFKDKHIVINQGRILAKLQDSKKHNIFYRFDPENLQRDLHRDIHSLVQEWEFQNKELQNIQHPGEPWPVKKGSEEVIIVPELSYFITLMNLFSNLVQGKQIVNIGKCRQVHSYSMLMDILKSTGLCYPLKAHLRNYINELYYSTRIEQDLCVEIITLQIPLLIKDLNILITILSKERKGRYKILHPIRYKFFESYIYLYIEQIAYTMNYLLTDQVFLLQLKKQLDSNYGAYKYQLHYYIIRIYERLRWILNYYYGHKYIRGFFNKITNKMKDIFLIYFKDNALNVFDKSQEKLHDPENPVHEMGGQKKKKAISQNRLKALKKRSKKLLHKLVQAQIGNYFTEQRPEKDKNFPLTFFLPYDEDDQPVQTEVSGADKQEVERKVAQKLKMMLFRSGKSQKKQDEHSQKLADLRKSLEGDENFTLFMKSFIEASSQELFQVSSFFKQFYKFKVEFISFKQYIRIFVEVNTNSPSQIPTELKIFFFQILLEYITKHNSSQKLKPIQEWSKCDFDQQTDAKIKQAQQFLADSNVSELIIETLKNTQDLELISIILQFGIAFTLGGNTKCQNSILLKLKADQKNELFIKIESIISKLGKKISSRIEQVIFNIEPRSDEFVVQSLDRYQFYDQPTRTLRRFGGFEQDRDEQDEEKLEVRVFGCLFRFMQLLCECNNIEFKNFIREQRNPDGSKKSATINILNMTTFEIRRLFKVMSNDASVIILPLTNFLNQVVSLPCQENQLALCDTTFFEDLCYMSTFFEDQKNLKQFRLNDRESLKRLFHLYQCCILVILNILEGNSQDLNRAFLMKLDVKFLLKVIKQNFEILEIKKIDDLKSFFEDKTKIKEHVPPQLQNAVNVMIVLLKLQSSEGSQAFIDKKKLVLLEIEQKADYPLKQLMDYLQGKIQKIEIVSTLGKQYIYFPEHPILTKLSHPTRNRIMLDVSRSTQREKIKSLLKFQEEIFTEIKHNFSIEKQKYHGMEISTNQTQKIQTYMFNISYIIIILWFMTTDVVVQFQEVQYLQPKYVAPVLKVLDLIQLGITVFYTFLYIKIKFALADYRSKKQKKQEEEEAERQKRFIQKEGESGQQDGEGQPQQQEQPGKLKKITESLKNKISQNSIIILLNYDDSFFQVLLYLFASFFGTFFDQKLFLLYILYYFMLNQNLQNVFKAITFNLSSLFSIGMLGFVFVYIFCLIFYDTYALDLAQNSNCYTIYGCLMDLYVSGTIGGSVEELEPMRFATDMIYFIFFDLLFGNIVSGKMIDTFAELRSQREEMTDDKKNKCYICGRSRGQLQKNNEKFEEHINNKHFLWNYIYYIHCLKNKNQTEYSGLEYEIRVCIDKGENEEDYIKWIPFGEDDANEDAEKTKELISLMENLNITTKGFLDTRALTESPEQA